MPKGVYQRNEKQIEKLRFFRLGKKLSEEHKKKIGKKSKGNHYAWKGGSDRYWGNIAKTIYKEHYINIICEKCGSPNDICFHHKDKNIKNNDIKNLQALCRSCHTSIHQKGHIVSIETRKKISNFMKGKISWWKGKHLSIETRKKMSIAHTLLKH